MSRRLALWAIIAVTLIVLAANTFFIVDQRKQVVVFNLGQPVRVINPPGVPNEPGLYMKVPFVESVAEFDKRNQPIEAQQEEVISADQQRLVVDAFVRYRVANPLQFYRTLGSEANAPNRMEPLINSALRQVLGGATASDIIYGRRDALMAEALADVRARTTKAHYGVEVIDLRLKRADLPQANQEAVFARMKSSLQQQAAQIRAEGEQHKREVIAEADKEVTITIAEAQAQASTTEGAGDAESTRIYAAAFGKDPRFAAFFRSMAAYEGVFADGDPATPPTTMVLSTDSDFFKYMKKGPEAH
jgi:membrane protease subunit HflC